MDNAFGKPEKTTKQPLSYESRYTGFLSRRPELFPTQIAISFRKLFALPFSSRGQVPICLGGGKGHERMRETEAGEVGERDAFV